MEKIVRVRPAADLRREFAKHVAGRRGVRMVSAWEFGLPPEVFTALPETLLEGAFVDSRPYQARPLAGHEQRRRTAPVFLRNVPPADRQVVAPADPDVEPDEPVEDTGPAETVEEEVATTVVTSPSPTLVVDDGPYPTTPALTIPDAATIGPLPAPDTRTSGEGDLSPGDTTDGVTCPEPGCGYTTRSGHGMKVHLGKAHNGKRNHHSGGDR